MERPIYEENTDFYLNSCEPCRYLLPIVGRPGKRS